nr:MAG TPA: hypothetical protein [Bacteriophage sp.]
MSKNLIQKVRRVKAAQTDRLYYVGKTGRS